MLRPKYLDSKFCLNVHALQQRNVHTSSQMCCKCFAPERLFLFPGCKGQAQTRCVPFSNLGARPRLTALFWRGLLIFCCLISSLLLSLISLLSVDLQCSLIFPFQHLLLSLSGTALSAQVCLPPKMRKNPGSLLC